MGNKIRLVWDFRGMDGLKTAEHQLIHLVQFMKEQDIIFFEDKVEHVNDMHSICSITINDSDLDFVKNRLKPHRGFLAN
jgi:hypothetical protein